MLSLGLKLAPATSPNRDSDRREMGTEGRLPVGELNLSGSSRGKPSPPANANCRWAKAAQPHPESTP
jgi:hypothetical protein